MAKVPKTNYMKHCDHFTEDVKDCHAAEYALMPFDGAFVIVHKRAFNVPSIASDSIVFNDCIFQGRGTAAFQHVTSGTLWPMFPTRPTITSTGEVSDPKRGESFMDRAIVLSGGEHLDDVNKLFDLTLSDDDLMALSDHVRYKQRSNAFRGNPYGAAEVLNFTKNNEEHVLRIYEDYFAFVPEAERVNYLLYFFGNPSTMIAYALANYNESLAQVSVRRHRSDAQQPTDDNVYVHPYTFRAPVDNKRLNLSDNPEYMCYFRPVVHASNEVMLYQELKILSEAVQDPVIVDYNKIHGTVLSQNLDKYGVMMNDTYMASQVTSVILSTFGAPMVMHHDYPSAEAALNTRLNFIRTTMIRQEKFRNDILIKDAIAAGSVGRSVMNSISPSHTRTYRDDGNPNNIYHQHGSSGYRSPWLPTHRSTVLYSAHRAKQLRREIDGEISSDISDIIDMEAAMAPSIIHLAAIVDLNNVYNAEHFVDRLSMIAEAGETTKKSSDDYRAHEIKMGGCELGKEMDSAIEVILAHMQYDIALFKRCFLQYSWHLLGGLEGIKLALDRLPVKDDVYDCAACAGLPFYEKRELSPRHCFCYLLLRVFAKLTHMDVNSLHTAKKVSDLYMTQLYKNPYASDMTSMKISLCCRVVESRSKYGSFGSLKLKHAHKKDGLKQCQKREERVKDATTAVSASGTNIVPGSIGNTTTNRPVLPTVETTKSIADTLDKKDDESYKEAIELAGIERRILAKIPTILSAEQSKINDEGSSTMQYLTEVSKLPSAEEGKSIHVGQVRFDVNSAIKKQLVNDPYVLSGKKTTIDPFAANDSPFQVIPPDKDGASNGWNDVLSAGLDQNTSNNNFDWEPPTKKRKVSKSDTLCEKMRRFVRAVAYAYVSKENTADLEALTKLSRAEMGQEHAALLVEWREADIETQKRYARTFVRAFLEVLLRHPSKTTQSEEYYGVVGRAILVYLDTVSLASRNIHAAVAEEMGMTPEEFDTAALRDIVHQNNFAGELFSWIDPSSGDAQVSARSERNAQFMLVRHIWDVRAMSKMPETSEIHSLQIEKYTSGASAENGPHSVRLSMTLPLYTPQLVQDTADLPVMSLNPTAASTAEVICVNDLPIQMKVGVTLVAFEPDTASNDGLKSKTFVDKTTRDLNQADYGTVPVGMEMDNGGLFKPFPLLADNGSLVTSRSKARSANDLAKDLRQNSLKIHRLGLHDSVDPTCTQDGLRWLTEYLEQRRDINNQLSLPSVTQNLLTDMNALCGVIPSIYYLLLSILSNHLSDDTMAILRPLKSEFAKKLYTRELLYANMRALFVRRPELLGTMNVICACAEMYGVRHATEHPIFDREYERDAGMVKIMISGSIRLFVGRSGGDKVIRAQTDRQTALLPIRVTYADESIIKGKPTNAMTYADGMTTHSSQIITAATVVSYPSRDGAKKFTRIRGGATFNRRTVTSGMSRMGIKTDDKEVTIIKKPMVHFPNALGTSGGKDYTDDLLLTSTLDTIMRMFHTEQITLTKLARHFTDAVATRFDLNSNGWLNPENASKERLVEYLYQERFVAEPDANRRLFEEDLMNKLYPVMCGENDTSAPCGSSFAFDSFMDCDEDEDDEEEV